MWILTLLRYKILDNLLAHINWAFEMSVDLSVKSVQLKGVAVTSGSFFKLQVRSQFSVITLVVVFFNTMFC